MMISPTASTGSPRSEEALSLGDPLSGSPWEPRWRFRRKGYAPHSFKAPYGTKDFEREYAACLSVEPVQIGASRIIAGSVADVISRYYSDNAFLDLKPSTQTVYRGVLERFWK